MHDSEIAHGKSEDVVEVPGGKRLQINSGGNGDAIPSRAQEAFRLPLLRYKSSDRLGSRCQKYIVHGRSMFSCVGTDVIDGAIGEALRKETGAEVEWVTQMDPMRATVEKIISDAGDGRTERKARMLESIFAITGDPERQKIVTAAAVVHQDTLHESAE